MGGDTAVLKAGEDTLATVAERTVVVEVGGDSAAVIVGEVVGVVAGEGDEVSVAPCRDIVIIEPVCTKMSRKYTCSKGHQHNTQH